MNQFKILTALSVPALLAASGCGPLAITGASSAKAGFRNGRPSPSTRRSNRSRYA